MNINKKINGKELTLAVEGRLDTITAPQLEAELKRSVGDTERLIFDLSSLVYILRRPACIAVCAESHEQAGGDGSKECERDGHGSI